MPRIRFPKARRFVVAQMDPVAMVVKLGLDAQAVAEAKAMMPKKYLVYLDVPLDLPTPRHDSCRYLVNPVAATLRPASPERGITPDMVMPISPNNDHAKGRTPLCAQPPFPFPNCYFWIESSMPLRVRPIPGGFDLDRSPGIELPIRAHIGLRECWRPDLYRMLELSRRYEGEDGRSDLVSPSVPPRLRDYPDLDPSSIFEHIEAEKSSHPQAREDCDSSPFHVFVEQNVFGWEPDPRFKFIPLVDVYIELEEHLSADSIPNPDELWQEQEKIGGIIQAGLERRVTQLPRPVPSPPSPPPPPPLLQPSPIVSATSAPARSQSPNPHRRPPSHGRSPGNSRSSTSPIRQQSPTHPHASNARTGPDAHIERDQASTVPVAGRSSGPVVRRVVSPPHPRRINAVGGSTYQRQREPEGDDSTSPTSPTSWSGLFKKAGSLVLGSQPAIWSTRPSPSSTPGEQSRTGPPSADAPRSYASAAKSNPSQKKPRRESRGGIKMTGGA